MKAHLIACMTLLIIAQTATAAEHSNMEVRRFTVLPTTGERIAEMGKGDWQEFFTRLGVAWPEGSSIEYFPSFGKLVVKNSLENLRALEDILIDGPMIPFQVEVQMDFIQFTMDDIDRLAREGNLTSTALLDLWKKAKHVCSTRLAF